jgi:hypothetical protein
MSADTLAVAAELTDCWLPTPRRYRAIKAGDVLAMIGRLYQVEWINHGGGWRSTGRPQIKVVGHPPFGIDPDEEVVVLVPTLERDALAVIRAADPGAYAIADCAGHTHADDAEGAA